MLVVLPLVAAGGVAYWFVTPLSKFSELRCSPEASRCREISGRVLYVERVDPDGDDDVHLVLVDRDSLTRRYISVLKLPDDRRGDPPGFGTWVSATGTTYLGASRRTNLKVRRLRIAR